MKNGNDTAKRILAIVCNLINAALVIYSVAGFFVRGGSGNMEVAGTKCFRYFTIDSNILSALSSLSAAAYLLTHRNQALPKGILLFRFIGTTAVTVTIMTVFLFLGPTMGYGLMFVGSSLYLHLICPLLVILSFLFFESGEPIRFPVSFLGVLPTALYGAVYLSMVLITKNWPDFYGFNRGGFWYVSLPAMLIATYVLAILIWLPKRERHPKG